MSFPSSVRAFSLLGPLAPWMDAAKGYDLFGKIGGPMNLGEEYRWNIPVITYGFDPAFIDYFGEAGVEQVEAAIQILNALPPASELDPLDFPLNTRRHNFLAESLRLIDLKSTALHLLLGQLGLAPAEPHAWTLRDRRVITVNNTVTTNYFVIQRSFDPLTLSPSALVNGVSYNYRVAEYSLPGYADAEEIPVADPSTITFNSIAMGYLAAGDYYTNNLTRDDAGGLRYLLSAGNINAEQLLPDVTALDGSTAGLVNTALRPGVEKVTFLRMSFNTELEFKPPVTNTWTDTYYSNGVPHQQMVQRVMTRPDIIFTAADLGLQSLLGGPTLTRSTGTSNWINHASLYSALGGDGPGVIRPGIVIAFGKLGPALLNQPPFFLDTSSPLATYPFWGAYTTNEPVIFPKAALIQLSPIVEASSGGEQGEKSLRWTLWGPPTSTYRVETSPDLVNWYLLKTLTNHTGTVDILDAINGERKFYRVVSE